MEPMRILAALVTCLIAAFATTGVAWAAPNPANDPELLGTPIESEEYDYAHRCVRKARPGTRALESWVGRHFRGESWGIVRCEKLSKTTRSVHSEGRALDWHLDARNKGERRAAYLLIEQLLETDSLGNTHALARRMGVQEIIFNCESWFPSREGLEPYSACKRRKVDSTPAHRDHVHIGLNHAGAEAETSFWRSGLASQ